MLAKISKIARFILLLLFFSIGLLYIIFKSTPVQTWLAQKATYYLSDKMGTKVRVSGVDIDFFKTAVLQHVYIEDLHQDTLFYFRNIKFDYKTFDNIKRIISLNELTIEGGKVLFGEHKGDTVSNYQFFIDFFDNGPRDPTKPKVIWTIFSKKVNLINTRFDYFDRNSPKPDFMTFNYNEMSYRNINGTFEDFYLVDDSLHFQSKHLDFRESCGLQVTEFMADAKIHAGGLEFEKLQIQTVNNTLLKDQLKLLSKSWKDYNDFNNKIYMKANLKDAIIDSRDLAFFSNYLKEYETPIFANGYAEGYLTHIHGKNAYFKLYNNTIYEGNWSLQGLPDFDNTVMQFDVNNFRTNYNDLNKISLGNLPSNISTLGTINYKGSFSGFYNDFVTYGKIKTILGEFDADMNLKFKEGLEKATYSGKLKTSLFKLRSFLPDAPFDDAAFDLKIKGEGIDALKYKLDVEGDINQIAFQNYIYHNTKIKGTISRQLFSGYAIIRDQHLTMDFDGEFNSALKVPEAVFNVKIVNADLASLGFDKQAQNLKGNFNFNFKGNTIDDAIGTIQGKEISIFRNDYLVKIPLINFSSLPIATQVKSLSQKELKVESDIIDINLTGNYSLSNLDVSIRYLMHELIPVYFLKPTQKLPNEDFKFTLDIKQPDDITKLYLPELSLSPSKADGFYKSSDQTIALNSTIDRLEYKEYHVSNLELKALKKADSLMNISVSAENLSNGTSVKNTSFKLNSVISDNIINYNLNGQDTGYAVSLDSKGKLIFSKDSIRMNISHTNVMVGKEDWLLNDDAYILFTDKKYQLANIVFRNELQKLDIFGQFGNNSINTLNVNIDDLALNTINTILKDKKLPLLNGVSKGNIIYTLSGDKTVLTSNINITNLSLENDTIGNLTIYSTSKDNSAIQDINIRIDGGTLDSLSISGVIDFKGEAENMDLDIYLPPSDIKVVQPFLKDLVSNMSGKIFTEDLTLKGSFDKPELKGLIHVNKAAMLIDYLNVPVSFSTIINVQENIFKIGTFELFDDRGHKGIAGGSIRHQNFSNFKLDFEIADMKKFHALNTTATENDLYYGQAYANGNIYLNGPFDNMDIKIDAVTMPGTYFYLPINEGDASGIPNYIHFKTTKKKVKREEDDFPIHSLVMDVEATKDANIEIIFDETLGDKISGFGNGNIKMEMTKSGDFYMFGTYKIAKGKYLFTAFDIYNKPFNVKPGGTITWYGDPLEAQLNLVAYTSERANPAPLLADITTTGGTLPPIITAESELFIKGNLFSPEIVFGLDFPKLASEVTNSRSVELTSVISRIKADKEEVTRQVFSLLIMKQFVTPYFAQNGTTGVNNAGTAALSSAGSDLLSAQLSNWLSKIDPTWKVNVIYKNGNAYLNTEYGLALSKRFLNDKLTFDGSYSNLTNIPNINIEYKVTKKGNLSVKAYTRSNVNQVNTVSLNTPINTTGVGLVYTKEFNRVFRKNKHKKKKAVVAKPVN